MRHVVFKILLFTFIGCLIVAGVLFVYKFMQKYFFDIEEPYYATVINVSKGSVVILDSDKTVGLAGVHIPHDKGAANYIHGLLDEPRKLLNGQKVKIQLMERYRSGGVANYDLVRIYLEDRTCANDYLLKNGLAFFDHGYHKDTNHYLELEEKAKREKSGLWKNKDRLKLLYVGSKNLEAIHYPECPEVKKIKPADRVEYYHKPPYIHWYKDPYPHGCKYCNEIKKTKPKNMR